MGIGWDFFTGEAAGVHVVAFAIGAVGVVGFENGEGEWELPGGVIGGSLGRWGLFNKMNMGGEEIEIGLVGGCHGQVL